MKEHLVHVHGFTPEVSGLLWFPDPQRLAYAAGCRIVLLDELGNQTYMRQQHPITAICGVEHSFQNCSMPLKSEPLVGVATYDGSNAEIRALSLTSKRSFGPFRFNSRITQISFSYDGSFLITIAGNRDHTIAVWNLQQKATQRPLEHASYAAPVHGLIAPRHPQTRLISYGVAHIKFWNLEARGKLRLEGRRGTFGSHKGPKIVTTVAYMGHDKCAVGGNEGQVYIFEKTIAVKSFNLSSPRPVCWLHSSPIGISVATSDGKLTLLGEKSKLLFTLPGNHIDSKFFTPILRGVKLGTHSVVLMSSSHIVRIDDKQNVSVLTQQSSKNISSIAVHPRLGIVVGSLDGSVLCYEHTAPGCCTKALKCASPVTTVALSSGATPWLAIGCENSTVEILSTSNWQYVYRRRVSATASALTCSAFHYCSTGEFLAVGDADGVVTIYLFKERDGAATGAVHSGSEAVVKHAQLRGQTSSIRSIAFAQTRDDNSRSTLLTLGTNGRFVAFCAKTATRFHTWDDVVVSPWAFPTGPKVEHLPALSWAHEIEGGFVSTHAEGDTHSVQIHRGEPLRVGIFPSITTAGVVDENSVAVCSGSTVSVMALDLPQTPRTPTYAQLQKELVEAEEDKQMDVELESKPVAVKIPCDEPAVVDEDIVVEEVDPCDEFAQLAPWDGKRASSDFDATLPGISATPTPTRADPAPSHRTFEESSPVAWIPHPRAVSRGEKDNYARSVSDFNDSPRPHAAKGAGTIVSQSTPAFQATTFSRTKSELGHLMAPDGDADPLERSSVGLRDMLFKKREKRNQISTKVGAIVHASLPNVAYLAATEEARDRAEIIKHRHGSSSVKDLLQQKGPARAPPRDHMGSGPFRYVVDRQPGEWRIDMELCGGVITKVSRNAYKRCLTFEGDITHRWKTCNDTLAEKFEIVVPGEYDVTGDIIITKNYAEGKCSVGVPKRRSDRHKQFEDVEV